jgi:hypothetical protein
LWFGLGWVGLGRLMDRWKMKIGMLSIDDQRLGSMGF